MAPPLKPKEQRRNRGVPAQGDWTVLDEAYDGPIPPLPAVYKWSKDTERWWGVIWRTKMATQWDEGDLEGLSVLAVARQKLLKGDMRLLKEVRQGHDDFGLSPKGRQLRRWIITDKDAERAGIVLEDEVSNLREERAKRVAGG